MERLGNQPSQHSNRSADTRSSVGNQPSEIVLDSPPLSRPMPDLRPSGSRYTDSELNQRHSYRNSHRRLHSGARLGRDARYQERDGGSATGLDDNRGGSSALPGLQYAYGRNIQESDMDRGLVNMSDEFDSDDYELPSLVWRNDMSYRQQTSGDSRNFGLDEAVFPGRSRVLDDELVEVELFVGQDRINPRPDLESVTRPQSQEEVIDLTNEPDSPIQPQPSRHTHRTSRRHVSHPRRSQTTSQRTNPTFLPLPATVIDLTEDSPDANPSSAPGNRSPELFIVEALSAPPNAGSRPQSVSLPRIEPPPINTFGTFFETVIGAIRGRNHHRVDENFDLLRHSPIFNPLGNAPPRFDYRNGAFDQRLQSPKPPQEPQLPTREGFTRDTGTEVVIVCPACNEELAYDPDQQMEDSGSSKKPRSKKDKGEHHFWALKACGHVSILPAKTSISST
jgi:hypothetical protein